MIADDARRHDARRDQNQRINALLSESGVDTCPADPLVSVLVALAATGAGEAPDPSPELAALLETPPPTNRAHAPRRSGSHRVRGVVVSLTVAACLSGVGVAAAAATNEGFRHSVGHTFSVIVGSITGTRHQSRSPLGVDPRTGGRPGSPAVSPTTNLPTTGVTVVPVTPPSRSPGSFGSAARSVALNPPAIAPGQGARQPTPGAPGFVPTTPRPTTHPSTPPTTAMPTTGAPAVDPSGAPSSVPGGAHR